MAMRINLGELIHHLANTHKDRPAVTVAASGEEYTYQQLENHINKIAHGLKALKNNDSYYISIMHENDINYLALTYALKKINQVEVSINRAFRGPALVRMINLTKCSILVTSKAHFEILQDVQDQLIHLKTLIVTDDVKGAELLFSQWNIISWHEILADNTQHITSNAKDTDLATIMFTSGTTGVSKGCLLSHRYAVRTAENMIAPFKLTEDDVNYTPYPLSHIGSAYYDILPSLMIGGRVVIRDHFSLSNFWDEIRHHGVTWFMCLGSVQHLLYSAPPSFQDRNHKVTRCWATPAPVPKEDFDDRFGLHLLPGGGYGSTDAGWVATPQWNHPGGKVLPHYQVAILDENDDLLPHGQKGEIAIRPQEAGVMADGYFGMPEKTLESRRNLWFHTGDIGWMDQEGHLYFSCRISERIRVKGEMVSGFEVEEAVLRHPEIEDAVAIAIPAPMGEEEIRLFLTLNVLSTLTKEDILNYCKKNMASFMVPRIITILEKIPYTPTGKPERCKLVEYD